MIPIQLGRQALSFGVGVNQAYQRMQSGDRIGAAEQMAMSALELPSLINGLRQSAQLFRMAAQGGPALRAFLTNCFGAGTPIQGEFGSKPIEQFVPGERVWARNENDPHGPLELKAIEECFVAEAALWHVHVGGQVIRTTDEHPFWVIGKGWSSAKALQAGDRLIGRNGTETVVEEAYETGVIETVYNFRVAEHHTYYIGSDAWGFDVWAHNRCSPVQQLTQNSQSSRKSLRVAMSGLPANSQAHHVIPHQLNNLAIMRLAALGGFTVNGRANGIILPTTIHRGSHRNYTDAVRQRILEIADEVSTPAQAAAALNKLVNQLKRNLRNRTTRLN